MMSYACTVVLYVYLAFLIIFASVSLYRLCQSDKKKKEDAKEAKGK